MKTKISLLLAVMLILSGCTPTPDSEKETDSAETNVPAESVVETEPAATDAPATDPVTTNAPETVPVETEAPETDSPVVELPFVPFH